MKPDAIKILKMEITTRGIDILLIEYTDLGIANRFLVTWCQEGETEGKYFARWLPDSRDILKAKNPVYYNRTKNNDERFTGYPALTKSQAEKRFEEMVALVPTMQFIKRPMK